MGMADSCGRAYLFISRTSLLKNWESDTNQKIAKLENTYNNILRKLGRCDKKCFRQAMVHGSFTFFGIKTSEY